MTCRWGAQPGQVAIRLLRRKSDTLVVPVKDGDHIAQPVVAIDDGVAAEKKVGK